MLAMDLDPTAAAARLAQTGRAQLMDALQPSAAEDLHALLAGHVPWGLAHLEAGKPRTLPYDRLRALTHAQRAELGARIQAEARAGYQFMYHSYMMVTAYVEGRDPQLPLHRVLEYLNGEPFLDFARRLTGVPELRRANAQATCYLPGDFLKFHTDADSSEGRRFAYVLNLTRGWQADWGGLLQFLDADGAVLETFLPRWNSLSIFRVPTPHCVSQVAAWAAAPRLAITGWLLDA
jgi:Rps23 Pro-64 3,4-dihydroxylase Tpa1-like proline 4-hydroxylase